MSGVCVDGSLLETALKINYVRYIEKYIKGHTASVTLPDGTVIPGIPILAEQDHYSNAKINGNVVSSAKLKVQNISVCTVDNLTQEEWQADPTPYPHLSGSIISISPSSNGSGQGRVTSGSPKVFFQGKAVAKIGSRVNTHLNQETTIATGSSKMFIP
ncbi:PAAR domain-containing protein [Paenibacillus sp. UMB4589-SE434]|uniref:PAAR domain-containing protein n=1 Tax=Paenibacillus sp. UMB4589-SE434 TaxID=3046314 RepID=UPI00254D1D67|nr:PAAR domain-containing protein [Paenibacillus sp. UMB4589-SE434]MDK8179410.1 PAAR domain-containing protein [Paenibacillus sp. UMB4589-SE434]